MCMLYQNIGHAYLLKILARKKRLEAWCSMLYQLVLNLAKSSLAIISNRRMSVGTALYLEKDDEAVQQALGDLEIKHMEEELKLVTKDKHEA